MVARADLKTRVGTILARKARTELGNGASVRVEKSHYRDYVHVYVTSRKFARRTREERSALIWGWLEADLSREELAKVTLVMALTPTEERDLMGALR